MVRRSPGGRSDLLLRKVESRAAARRFQEHSDGFTVKDVHDYAECYKPESPGKRPTFHKLPRSRSIQLRIILGSA